MVQIGNTFDLKFVTCFKTLFIQKRFHFAFGYHFEIVPYVCGNVLKTVSVQEIAETL